MIVNLLIETVTSLNDALKHTNSIKYTTKTYVGDINSESCTIKD